MYYFDNAATTAPSAESLEVFNKVSQQYYYNTASIHGGGKRASQLLESARTQLKTLIELPDYKCIFTSGATESNNLVIKSVLEQKAHSGNTILVSGLEHPSVIETLRIFKNYKLKVIKTDKDGHVDLASLESMLDDDVVFLSVIAVNNILGTIQPIEQIAQIIKKYPKIFFHVDATQAIGKVDINYNNVHAVSISGHKFYGPKGIGALFLHPNTKISTVMHGGGHEHGLRSGTVNLPGIVAMVRALRVTLDDKELASERLSKYKMKILNALNHPKIEVHPSDLPHFINMSIRGVKGEVIVNVLNRFDVYISTTSACHSNQQKPNETLLAIGRDAVAIAGSIRISMGHHTDNEDVEQLIHALKAALEEVKEVL